nr:MAG: ORF1 [Torque teno midi virus]
MPFWWRRRRKYWYNRRYKPKKRTYRRRWPRRRLRRRRRPRRTYRRRRRRPYKVRRKKQTIPIRQWQPDSIVNCKIKGVGVLVLGAEGRQMFCWTPNKDNYTPPRTPCGGGFGVEEFTLEYLYEENKFQNNIWTKTNMYKDLCRYLRVTFTFYRHPYVDFIIAYERMPPFELTKFVYPSCHPLQLLLSKHKKILLSKKSKPNGRTKLKIKIKPPKQMITKWFFTAQFCKYTLLLLKAAAADFSAGYLQNGGENQQTTIIFLNTSFYQNGNWGAVQSTTYYKPWSTVPKELIYSYMKGNSLVQDKIGPFDNTQKGYYDSISIDKGFFKPTLLQAVSFQPTQANLPIGVARYNPNIDNGKDNMIWLASSLTTTYEPPHRDSDLLFKNLPLWLMLLGWFDYLKEKKHDPNYLESYYLVIKSPSIHFYSSTLEREPYFIPIDKTFYEGKAPYNAILTDTMKKNWFPTIKHQLQTLNAIVESSPLVPKFANKSDSTWELKYHYNFHFKWGGPEISDQQIEDPAQLNSYAVPDTVLQTVQIQNPAKQKASTFLHAWDVRRGIITQRALKRMCEDLETDTDFQPDADIQQPQKKKKRIGAHLKDPYQEQEEIQKCLLSLCEEPIYQETQEEKDLQHLIQQQQQQQLELKRNILQLLSDLKYKQQMLQLQTGLL